MEAAPSATDATPAALGFRMPAEWEPHAATWLTWPHNEETWPGRLDEVEACYAAVVDALLPSERVVVLVADAGVEARCRRRLAGRCPELLRVPNDDAWMRDHGPIFLVRELAPGRRERAACGFRFNAWGEKYPPWDRDAKVARRVAEAVGGRFWAPGIVLEGGSIEVDGAGTLLTTESCLLHPNRNPTLDRADLEATLRAFLGVERVIWLGDGIAGDDTDGHIDDLARFCAPGRVVAVTEPDPADENHAPLAENLRRLRAARDAQDRPLQVWELPSPPALWSSDGDRLPASYANFYVANGVVLMPAYDPGTDRLAQSVLERAFPGRRVVPIGCRDLVLGLGALHCVTQQQPAV